MNSFLKLLGGCLILAAIPCAARDNADRVVLFPKLSVGQTLRYQIGYSAKTIMNTESTVAVPMAPTGGQTNENLLLLVEVEDLRVDADRTVARLRTRMVEADAGAAAATASDGKAATKSAQNPDEAAKSGKREKTVEFVLHADGQVTDVEGLDRLSADEQAAWQEWVARFGGGAAFPEKGIKPGEKWKAEEPIINALLAGLSWEKESEYVNDAPCGAMSLTPQGDLAAGEQTQETCAVILTTAILKQKSSQKDATPEDYKLHDLRTMGIAKGKNETITYISLKTGLVVRATEDANQSMNVIVAKTDGSNRVHYMIDAESHAQVMLLAETPANHP
ncbi:MAG TPA: hypothetical protein VKH63_03005 [Candidatus Acidoferrum sp.]|nr:hypothetical protein [Candidatus Acidoferrum sp.]